MGDHGPSRLVVPGATISSLRLRARASQVSLDRIQDFERRWIVERQAAPDVAAVTASQFPNKPLETRDSRMEEHTEAQQTEPAQRF